MHITSMLNLRGGPCLLEIVDITADSGLYCDSPCELDENLVYAANRELIRVMLIAYSGFKLAVSSVLQRGEQDACNIIYLLVPVPLFACLFKS